MELIWTWALAMGGFIFINLLLLLSQKYIFSKPFEILNIILENICAIILAIFNGYIITYIFESVFIEGLILDKSLQLNNITTLSIIILLLALVIDLIYETLFCKSIKDDFILEFNLPLVHFTMTCVGVCLIINIGIYVIY